MEIHKNERLRLVERPGALDRYGAPQYETVYSQVGCRLERRTRFVRTPTGDQLMIDATAWIDGPYDFVVGDRLTLDNERADRYNVFSVDEPLGVDGVRAYTRLFLTQQR